MDGLNNDHGSWKWPWWWSWRCLTLEYRWTFVLTEQTRLAAKFASNFKLAAAEIKLSVELELFSLRWEIKLNFQLETSQECETILISLFGHDYSHGLGLCRSGGQLWGQSRGGPWVPSCRPAMVSFMGVSPWVCNKSLKSPMFWV